MTFPLHLLLTTQRRLDWLPALDDNAPVLVISCTVVLLAAVLAFTLLLMKRRDMAAILQADETFVNALQSSAHVLSIYQDQTTFAGSSRWQIYLAACRELCFYLLGTDQVEKNFATRLRAAGRVSTSQMAAVLRAMRVAAAECTLALRTVLPGSFLCGLPLPFLGLFGSIAIVLAIIANHPAPQTDILHLLLPAAPPFVLSVIALAILLPLGRGLAAQVREHETRMQIFPLSLGNLMERVFVDHRQSLEELPSVVGLGTPHTPSLSMPPTDQSGRAGL